MSPAKITIECPAPACGHRYRDRLGSSIGGALCPGLDAGRRPASRTTCPKCGQAIELGLLVLDDDGCWHVSHFAGHADDVTLIEPPGGNVSYDPAAKPAPVTALSAAELRTRGRALAAIENRAPNVAAAMRRDAVRLALEAGVLYREELVCARAWLERGER